MIPPALEQQSSSKFPTPARRPPFHGWRHGRRRTRTTHDTTPYHEPANQQTSKPKTELAMKPISEIQDHIKAAAILAEEFAALNWNATNVTGGTLATDESGWKHYAWQVNFCPPQKGIISMPFRCGTGHATKPRASWQTPRPIPPKPCEVLACYCRDYRDSDCAFDSWCDELGYDPDSRKALAIYEECRAIGPKLRAMGLSREQIARFAALSFRL